MIKLIEITEENFIECIKLEVMEDQKKFVAENVRSLAQAWLNYKNARPFAIYNDETMVGFLMLDIDVNFDASNRVCGLWRFMIDKKFQGKGYGKLAMKELISFVKSNYNSQSIQTSFVPGNEVAQKLYEGVGFKATGEFDGDEIVMELNL